ncbi:Uncharacterized protein DAT39_017897, partial [Clarias magur]
AIQRQLPVKELCLEMKFATMKFTVLLSPVCILVKTALDLSGRKWLALSCK